MLIFSSNQIKQGSSFQYKKYTLTVLKKNSLTSVLVKNSKNQEFSMDYRLLMEDVKLGLCKFFKA